MLNNKTKNKTMNQIRFLIKFLINKSIVCFIPEIFTNLLLFIYYLQMHILHHNWKCSSIGSIYFLLSINGNLINIFIKYMISTTSSYFQYYFLLLFHINFTLKPAFMRKYFDNIILIKNRTIIIISIYNSLYRWRRSIN